jgi:hypothetical protein
MTTRRAMIAVSLASALPAPPAWAADEIQSVVVTPPRTVAIEFRASP